MVVRWARLLGVPQLPVLSSAATWSSPDAKSVVVLSPSSWRVASVCAAIAGWLPLLELVELRTKGDRCVKRMKSAATARAVICGVSVFVLTELINWCAGGRARGEAHTRFESFATTEQEQ